MSAAKSGRLTILRDAARTPLSDAHGDVMPFADLRYSIVGGGAFALLLRYSEVILRTRRVDTLSKPLNTAMILRWISRGACWFEDETGVRERIGVSALVALFGAALRDLAGKGRMLRAVTREIGAVESGAGRPLPPASLDMSSSPVYLRTDLIYGLRSGGSVGHIAGVLNHLDRFAGKPVFLTTDAIPTVREDIETLLLLPGGRFRDFNELPAIEFNLGYEDRAAELLHGRKVAFVYQRYSTNNYAGVKLSRQLGVPFVLEYNGSEIWIQRNWGKPLRHEALAEKIEILCLRAADVVVVVSRPMRDELAARGIDPAKILVNPNGVDPERYSPSADGSPVLAKYDLFGKTVVGFIGTFGSWHGAEVLAEAFGRLLAKRPELRGRLRLLMIGDGNTMPQVRERIARLGMGDVCVLTGAVPQEEGPAHLAACDILAAPHVPNPDGTSFFGSPTKLFEYMAMGKGIVASDLDQIGEVLRDGETARMVRPGDPASLADGLLDLVEDGPLRARLGKAARAEAVTRHTWEQHTRKIVEKLQERCGCGPAIT
jgi:glycosyltransferase involved in cell wall biosynthesis